MPFGKIEITATSWWLIVFFQDTLVGDKQQAVRETGGCERNYQRVHLTIRHPDCYPPRAQTFYVGLSVKRYRARTHTHTYKHASADAGNVVMILLLETAGRLKFSRRHQRSFAALRKRSKYCWFRDKGRQRIDTTLPHYRKSTSRLAAIYRQFFLIFEVIELRRSQMARRGIVGYAESLRNIAPDIVDAKNAQPRASLFFVFIKHFKYFLASSFALCRCSTDRIAQQVRSS